MKEMLVYPKSKLPDFGGVCALAVGFKKTDKTTIGTNNGYYSLNFVAEESCFLEINGAEYIAEKGDVFYIPPNMDYKYSGACGKLFWIRISGEAVKKYFYAMGFDTQNFVVKALSYAHLFKALKEIYVMFDEFQPSYDSVITSKLYELMKYMEYRYDDEYVGIASRVADFIDHNIDKGYNISQICNAFKTSRVTLTAHFKRDLGMTPIEYLTKARLENACRLLVSTDLSVNKIAQMCGFSTHYHFIRNFKNKYGVTPTQYRK